MEIIHSDKPWHGATNVLNSISNNAASFIGKFRPLQYFEEDAFLMVQIMRPDSYRLPDIYGKPGTDAANNLDNAIFPLWNDYFTDSENTNWSIRKMWNADTKIFTIGWYNIRSTIHR